jgi:hypothetical protein
MSSNLGQESAKIIPFPSKNGNFQRKAPQASNGPTAQKPAIQWGGSWYHQTAIDEASRDRKS